MSTYTILTTKHGRPKQFRYTVFGVIFLMTEPKILLGRSCQLEKGWDKTVLYKSPPPLSFTTDNALYSWLTSKGDFRSLLAINLAFHSYLQDNEICRLRIADICFPNHDLLADFSPQQCWLRGVKRKNRVKTSMFSF